MRFERAELRLERPWRTDFKPKSAKLKHKFRLEGPDLRLLRLDFRPERPDLRPDRPDLRPEKPDLRPDKPDLKSDRLGGGRINERVRLGVTVEILSP